MQTGPINDVVVLWKTEAPHVYEVTRGVSKPARTHSSAAPASDNTRLHIESNVTLGRQSISMSQLIVIPKCYKCDRLPS
jgi:hypothetical protein